MSAFLEDMFGLSGKVALLTGASGGIGEALATALARAGATVVLNGRNVGELERVQTLIKSAGGRAVIRAGDLVDVAACKALIDETVDKHSRLDILVNCAGMNRRKPLTDVTEEDFNTITAVNLRSPFFLSQAAHPVMAAQGGGRIVHVASLTSFMGLGTTSVYGATKAAIAQLTKTQAIEWARDNIQVNGLAPGFIETPLTASALWKDDRKREWLLGRIPAKRAGTPADMASTLLLLCAPASNYLTGQTISVDGGVLAGGSWED